LKIWIYIDWQLITLEFELPSHNVDLSYIETILTSL